MDETTLEQIVAAAPLMAALHKVKQQGATEFKEYWIGRIKHDRSKTAVGTTRWNWLDALAAHVEIIDAAAVVSAVPTTEEEVKMVEAVFEEAGITLPATLRRPPAAEEE